MEGQQLQLIGFACVLVGCIGVFSAALIGLWYSSRKTRKELEARLERYSAIRSVEEEVERLQGQRAAIAAELEREKGRAAQERTQLEQGKHKLESDIQSLRSQLHSLEERSDMEVVGFYHPEYDLIASEKYKERLDNIKARQKQLIKDKQAVICTTEWVVSGSRAEGRKQTNRTIKLALSAFNTRADNAILKVTYRNIETSRKRIRKIAKDINKLLEVQQTYITDAYLHLKLEELELAYKYAEKKQHEKEEEKAHREQMREEAAAKKEMAQKLKQAEQERQNFEKALEVARAEIAKGEASRAGELMAQIAELEAKLEEARSNERAISQAQLTKRGHIYVISNIGSFGPGVFKVGMTRRLDPMVRVHELGDASVPFRFDVHAMIYSEDAPALENAIHKRLEFGRVNRVNTRREFFKVPLSSIEAAVRELAPESAEIEFVKEPEAKEFYISQQEARELARQGQLVGIA